MQYTGWRMEKEQLEMAALQREKKGFTLVEMIVTLAIFGILMSFSVGAISSYQKYAVYRSNNEHAKILFQAAQSALSYYSASGQLEDLEKELYELGMVVPEEVTNKNLVFVMKQRDETENILCELLNGYITDPTVLQAAICIEMDVANALVSGVFYCDRAERFTYDGEMGKQVISIGTDRSEEKRKEQSVGYYGAKLP